MSKAEYRVRYAEPAEVRDGVVSVWTENLPVRGRAQAKFDWIYRDAPERPRGVFVLTAREGAADERIVGTAGLGIRTFHLGGQVLRAALLSDLAVERAHRTALPAIQLVRQARRVALEDFDFAYGYPNQSAEPLFCRCGYRRLGTHSRYALVLRHAPYVRRRMNIPVVPRIAGAVLDAGWILRRAPSWLRGLGAYRLAWITDMDARFDRLWERARGEYELIGTRDASFLRWRFLGHPERRFRIASISERGATDTIGAYAVLEREGETSYVRDLFGHKRALGPLLDRLALELICDGCTSMSMSFLGARDMVTLLEERGFVRRESTRAIVLDAGKGPGDLAARLGNALTWHLTDADEDT